jgi:hypothetical protein
MSPDAEAPRDLLPADPYIRDSVNHPGQIHLLRDSAVMEHGGRFVGKPWGHPV